MDIELENITKRYRQLDALKAINLTIRDGELTALLGPSGSGKTTLLRVIAGLEYADAGILRIGGVDATYTPVRKRNIGFVFQHYALFKHMTVFDNVAFGQRVRPRSVRLSQKEIHEKVSNLLDLLHIDMFHDRYPMELSGGQRQRVALARALAVEPKILLLDEPFGALDAKVRAELRRWLRKLHDRMNVTSVFVTHDQDEALEVADRVVVMSQGHIEQVGTPDEVYHEPVNAFVYDFLGNYNVFVGAVDDKGGVHVHHDTPQPAKPLLQYQPAVNSWRGIWLKLLQKYKMARKIHQATGHKQKRRRLQKPASSKEVTVFARPHDMEIQLAPVSQDALQATINYINTAGPIVKMECEDKNGHIIQMAITRERYHELGLALGALVYLRPTKLKIFSDAPD